MADSFDWQCPFCGRHAAITAERLFGLTAVMPIEHSEGRHAIELHAIVCPSKACRRYTLRVRRGPYEHIGGGLARLTKIVQAWELLPPSSARVLPVYVPKAIVDTYNEACAISRLSPQASASLSRRCLQGMIRDFWGISKGRLIDEIAALEEKVDALTWKAIDGTRRMGNIGAHMEKDINTIIEVDPGEAEALLRLIEILIDDWYVARHDREERLQVVVKVADLKAPTAAAPASNQA